MSFKFDHRLTLSQCIVSAGLSGLCSRTITAPADVIRTLIQVGIPQSKNGLRKLIVFVYQKEGVRGFLKGNLTGCIKLIPYTITQYLAFKKIRWTICDNLGHLSIFGTAVAGAGAGMTATVVNYPFDMIKTRLILQPIHPNPANYKGFMSALLCVIKDEGALSLYRGLAPTLTAFIPFSFTSFLTYESLDQLWFRRNQRMKISSTEILLQGVISSTVSMIVTFPFDVVRRMLQAHSPVLPNRGGVDCQFTTARGCGQALWRSYGIKGFWRGIIPALLRVIPYHSIMFLTYESSKRSFLYQNGYILSPWQELDPSIDQNLGMDEMQDIQDYDIIWHIEHHIEHAENSISDRYNGKET